MNIVLYKGNFAYNVVNYFVDELGKALERRGNNVQILDINCKDSQILIEQVNHIFSEKVDLVLSYNGIDLTFNKQFYSNLGIIMGNLFVDHPIYHLERLKNCLGKNIFCGLYDEGAINTTLKYISSNLNLTHFMHAGSYASSENFDKEYDVIVVGGLKSNISIKEKMNKLEDGNIKDIISNLYEKINENYTITLDDYINEQVLLYEIPENIIISNEFSIVLQYIYHFLDSAMRYKVRYKAILELINNGIRVDYFGNCEKELFKDNKNFINHGPKEYSEILEIMTKSKIVINDIPYFKNGSHERIFSAMLNKALVISNINNYSYNMYKDNESIVFYDVNKKNQLVEKVKYFLENEEERKRIVENAYDITSKYNTWDNRADEILQIYEFMKNNMD